MNPKRIREDRRQSINPRAKFLMERGFITEKEAILITKLVRAEDRELSIMGKLMLNEHWKKHWGYDKYTRKYRYREDKIRLQ